MIFNKFYWIFYQKTTINPTRPVREKKIHEAPASTANAPLLNLNLNYEKLRYKGTDI